MRVSPLSVTLGKPAPQSLNGKSFYSILAGERVNRSGYPIISILVVATQ